MKKILRFIHRWENRNTILLFNPDIIPSEVIGDIAESMHVYVCPAYGLKSGVKLVTKVSHDQR